jgi:hypothetical protein
MARRPVEPMRVRGGAVLLVFPGASPLAQPHVARVGGADVTFMGMQVHASPSDVLAARRTHVPRALQLDGADYDLWHDQDATERNAAVYALACAARPLPPGLAGWCILTPSN